MCHHWDYDHAYERPDEEETDDPEPERFRVLLEDDGAVVAGELPVDETEPAETADDPLADVPFVD